MPMKYCKARKGRKRLNMLLFYTSFLVMETSTTTCPEIAAYNEADYRCPTPTQDEVMQYEATQRATVTAIELVVRELPKEDLVSDLVDVSFLDKTGIIIQFINASCPGTFPIIGGLRIGLQDIRRAPQYLNKHRRVIKQHASNQLMKHFRDMEIGIGAGETLDIDDFGMSYTIASVNGTGSNLNPNKRTEGPLFYCHLPALLSPITTIHAEWGEQGKTPGEEVHVINAYISLYPHHLRRKVISKKIRDEKLMALSTESGASLGSTNGTKKNKGQPQTTNQGHSRSQPYYQRQNGDKESSSTLALRDEVRKLKDTIHKMQANLLLAPPLPKTKPLVWPKKNRGPELPDDM